MWKQVFLPSQINGRTGDNSINFFWEKVFLGALAGCRKAGIYLRLLTILAAMTNNNKVGSKVYLLSTTELTSFLPDLTRLGLTEESSTKQLYSSRSHKGL